MIKNRFLTCSLWCAAAALLICRPASAHHGSFALYDTAKTFTVKATVVELRYTNPHIQLFVDVKDQTGNLTRWAAEGPDPALLVESGWNRKRTEAALSPGATITITMAPSQTGKPIAEMSNITLANGESICGLSGARYSAACAGAGSTK